MAGRNRVLDDRLWDDQGLVWSSVTGTWADADAVTVMLQREQRVVVHGSGRPMRWLSAESARLSAKLWLGHFMIPGQTAVEPDPAGLSYAARVWRRGDQRLLGIQVFC